MAYGGCEGQDVVVKDSDNDGLSDEEEAKLGASGVRRIRDL